MKSVGGAYMNNINLNSLKVFLEVANSNSFLEASNKLYLSQPAVSRSIARLEEDLGMQLFYRANKGISLTASGEVLFNYLKDIKNLLDSCNRVLVSINNIEEGNIVIGIQSHIVRNYLMDKIDNFCLRHPKIKIQLIDASTTALIGKLESREVDFIIDASPIEMTYNNITIEPIKKLNTCFIKSVKNKKNINSIKNLETENMILPVARSSLRKNLEKEFKNNNVNVVPKLEFETEELIIEAVRRNLGIGYVVSYAIEYLIDANILEKINVKEKLPNVEINLLCIDNYLTNIAKLFIKEEIKDEK